MPSTVPSARSDGCLEQQVACDLIDLASEENAYYSGSCDSVSPSDEDTSGSIMLNPPSPATLSRSAANFCQILENAKCMPEAPTPRQAKLLLAWLTQTSVDKVSATSPSPSMTTVSCPEYGDLQDKLQRLESDRESLSLQVSILAEQVGAQTDKIRDLESMLEDKKVKLDSTEEMLHDELVTRTSLETNKLDLMGEISNLKLKMASLEREKFDREQKLKSAQNQIVQLQSYRGVGTKETVEDARFLHPVAASSLDRTQELNNLRAAVQKLLTNNAEKESEIESLRRCLEAETSCQYGTYRSAALDHGISSRKLPPGGVSEFLYLQSTAEHSPRYRKMLMMNTTGEYDAAESTSYQRHYGHPMVQQPPTQFSSNFMAGSQAMSKVRSSPVPMSVALPSRHHEASKQLAAELDQLALHCRSPVSTTLSLSPYHTGSLPRQTSHSPFGRYQNGDYDVHSDGPVGLPTSGRQNDNFKRNRKYSSLRNFVSKIKRSTSEEACAGRGSRKSSAHHPLDGPGLNLSPFDFNTKPGSFVRPTLSMFCKWNSEQLAEWFCDLGLSAYADDCRNNVKSGRHLINLTDDELEKYLNIKDHLHRKRLLISLKWIEVGKQQPTERMDCSSTSLWLDDIGLPQYKQVFAAYRIDGTMLDSLTVEDLLHMRITTALHHASLRRGIQILRMVGFNIGRLHRKLDPLLVSRGCCASVVQWWTQRCIGEWLKTSDLTEFAPNMLGSGVHGGLMILEPAFTAESLACVLQIPAQKTLLRRHLSTQFSNLIGADLVAAKRHFISQSEIPILTPKVKVKLNKKSAFLLPKKKGKNEMLCSSGDLVCPLIKRTTNAVALHSVANLQAPNCDQSDSRKSKSEEQLRNLTATNV